MKNLKLLIAAALAAMCLVNSNAYATLVPAITADVRDQEVYATPPHKWFGQNTARSGRGGPGAENAQLVLPFALPAIPSGEEVVSATLQFNLISVGAHSGLADLNVYGIRSAGTPNAVDGDFLDVSSLPSGTELIQSSIATFTGPLGLKNTSTAADLVLGTWIQSLYDGGAVPGDYAFISLAVSDPVATLASRYYTVTTANGASNLPTLSITSEAASVPEPSSLAFFGISLLAMNVLRKKV